MKKYIKLIIGFIAFNIIISIFTMPIMLAYGPFSSLRDVAIQTVMETRRGPRILGMFLSQDTLAKFSNENKNNDPNARDTNALKIDTSKHDQSIDVKILENNRFTYYVMIIHDPTRVKVVASKYIGDTGQRVSDMARQVNAVGAINGGGFVDKNWEGNGGIPIGITIANGKTISTNEGKSDYVIGLDKNGALMMGQWDYEQVKRLNIENCVSFPGPVLVRNGKAIGGGGGVNPRTAIGQTKDGAIIFLVVDGRSFKSQGATYKDLTDIMMEYGAYNAVNLDGGSSTTMYYDGEVINNPGNLMGERYVPTAFVVMP